MLGSLSEADDAVQDAWLRLGRANASEVENLRGWLTTVVARVVAEHAARRASTRREEPLDVRVPDPIVDPADGTDPEHEALLADSVGLALLVVLETLTPAERLAFVLHDMFAVPFEEIAPIVERSPRGGAPAGEPGPPPGPRCRTRARRRYWPPSARSSTRSSPPRASGDFERARRGARPRRRAPGRRRRRRRLREVQGAETVAARRCTWSSGSA